MAIGDNNQARTMAKPASNGQLTGFKVNTDDAMYRLLLNVQGLEKTGKDHLALTAPGPIAILSFDLGLEGVVHKFNKKKKLYVAEYELLAQPGVATEPEVEKEAKKLWDRVVSDYRDAFTSPSIRTVIVDTGSELWELKRLSEFGKMSANVQHYGPVNADFRRLIRIPYDTDKNFVMIHKMKDEWVRGADGKSGKTGKIERTGMKDMGFLLQGNVQTWKTNIDGGGTEFHATMLDCRQNPEVNGMDFSGTHMEWEGFGQIGMMVFPDSTPDHWGL